jgi:hypothetical protein
MGDYEHARSSFEEAYRLSGKPLVLLNLAQIAERLADYLAVERLADLFRRCAPELAEEHGERLEALESAAKAKVGQLIINLPESQDDLRVLLNGVPLEPVELGAAKRVNPGQHELITERGSERTYLIVMVGAGDSVSVSPDAPPDCGTEPCVCLQPCLIPPPPPPDPESVLGVAAGYDLWLHRPGDETSDTGHGVRAKIFYQAALGESLMLEVGLGGGSVWTERSSLVPVGGSVGLKAILGSLFVGLSPAGGYVYSNADRASAGAVVKSGVWFAPRLTMGSLLGRRWTVALESSPMLVSLEQDGDSRFGVGFVTYGVMLGYNITPRCAPDDYCGDAQLARF